MAETDTALPNLTPSRPRSRFWVYDLLILVVLLVGMYFRTVGLNWGENQYLHPDERFLIWVGTDMAPVDSLGEYFNTERSTLNPHNVGHGFYVYGTLPLVVARYIVQEVYGHSGFNEMTNVGRGLSTIADLLTVLLVYLIGARLYDKRVGLLGAGFSALAVMQIQQSHFFTTDNFIVVFTILAIYAASMVAMRPLAPAEEAAAPPAALPVEPEPAPPDEPFTEPEPLPAPRPASPLAGFFRSPLLYLVILFGVALGCAVASKINAVPVALALPAAFFIRWMSLPKENRSRYLATYAVYILIGGFFSLLTFRIAQPYAFAGPGFFDIGLNPKWLANMREVSAGAAGDIDYPYALQWGRRTHLFSAKNMLLWGMGIPMGLLAWAGFLYAGWRMIKRPGEWKHHLIPWFWVAVYFTWQSLQFNPTMRYQLPIYPILAMFAGWLIVTLWERGREIRQGVEVSHRRRRGGRALQVSAVLLGVLGLGLTLAWAFAFTRVYERPITRIEASRWIYQNVPGPINLHIQQEDGVFNQLLYYPNGFILDPSLPYTDHFTAQADGFLNSLTIGYLLDQSPTAQMTTLRATVSGFVGSDHVILSSEVTADLTSESKDRQAVFTFPQPFQVMTGEGYSLTLEVVESGRSVIVNGPITAAVATDTGMINHSLSYPTRAITGSQPYFNGFAADASGTLTEVLLTDVVEETASTGMDALVVTLTDTATNLPLASGQLEADLSLDPQTFAVTLTPPVTVTEGQAYGLEIRLQSQGGQVRIQGTTIANESDFDDSLPVRVEGYDAWAGIYPLGVVFQSYWDDNPEKLGRYVSVMETSDYIVMSSNRQWATIPRVPERYPMTTIFYRELMGCPATMEIVTCYTVAEEDMFEGRLGYRLVKVFQSNPSIGPFEINDQFAEEAFTVYEHPKVLIFEKTDDFDAEYVRSVLGAADFDHIQRLTPKNIPPQPADLMFPAYIFERLKLGGTWAELFNTAALQNRFPAIGAVVWYLFIFILGLAVYPFVRIALPGLNDRGYPLARIAGLVLLAYLSWLAGSLQIAVTRGTVAVVFFGMVAAGGWLAYRHRAELKREWRERRGYFLVIEGLFLLFFVLDLLIRLGNPDLWHPWKGGERPMDFAYFNAVLKSVTFPPFDPWFSGGYINYYYYGFVLVGMPTKLLGIVPAIAFNLIIPTMFSLIAMGAFSLAWNVFLAGRHQPGDDPTPAVDGEAEPAAALPLPGDSPGEPPAEIEEPHRSGGASPYLVGAAGALLMAVLGNLGTLRLISEGYQMLAAPAGIITDASFFQRAAWTVSGFFKALSGQTLPFGIDAWYWNPSRAILDGDLIQPITEFPFFTVLYGDPHAHLFAMPVALLAVAFIVSVVAARGRWKNLGGMIAGFLLGGLAVGATYPLNLTDIYTYLPLMVVPLAYVLFTYTQPGRWSQRLFPGFLQIEWSPAARRLIVRGAAAVLGAAALALLAFYLYEPYRFYYAQGYGDILRWTGPTTPSRSYLVHWGLFLFIFLTWFIYETWHWMASTPLSSLRKLAPYSVFILIFGFIVFIVIGILVALKAYIAWMAVPLAVWAGLLILRPRMPDMKRLVLFMIGTGMLITVVVEVVVARGDISRMNTVFKFYLQVWLMYAVCAAAILGWMFASMRRWRPGWSAAWQIGLVVLVLGASLYPLMASMAKIRDRWNTAAPHTLDGMAFMNYTVYNEMGADVDVSEEYRLVRWLQENVTGSPVIVEANSRDLYRMFNRVSMYTGLPGVAGWENHQLQQRGVLRDTRVPMRIDDINEFYTGIDIPATEEFLRRYGVKYVIVGQLERIHYPGEGLAKFPALEGALWNTVYRDGATVIYEVIER